MLISPPRGGKGTIGRVLKGVIGGDNVAAPKLASLAGPFGLWPLLGKHLALVADARLSGRTDAVAVVETLLSISGEDPQDVARKGLPTLAGIRLPVRFMLMTNELPNLQDASGALAKRLILLRMTKTVFDREDKKLTEKLLAERSGILNWAIRGWQKLRHADSFQQPESGRELLDDLSDMSSPISAFIRDHCLVSPEFSVSIKTAWEAWKAFCKEHGRDHHGTRETFGKNLRAALPQLKVTRPRGDDGIRDRIYSGLGLRSEAEPWGS